MNKFAYGISAAILAGLIAGPAMALPSAKAVMTMGTLVALGSACASQGDFTNVDGTPLEEALPCDAQRPDTGWIAVQSALIKTPNGKELAIDVSMQVGLVTFTQVKSKGGNKDGAQAEAGVKVRVRIEDLDNDLNVIGGPRYASPGEGDVAANGVTFNWRSQTLTATFQGLIADCIDEEGHIFLDDECLEPEAVSLLLETLSAHAFNFVAADEGPGIKRVTIEARAEAGTNLFGSMLGAAKGEAFVGLGSTLVETVRFIQGDDGTGTIHQLD